MNQQYLEGVVKRTHDDLKQCLNSPKATVVTIVSINPTVRGQWILGHPDQDPKEVAAHLRLCASILDPQQRDLT